MASLQNPHEFQPYSHKQYLQYFLRKRGQSPSTTILQYIRVVDSLSIRGNAMAMAMAIPMADGAIEICKGKQSKQESLQQLG